MLLAGLVVLLLAGAAAYFFYSRSAAIPKRKGTEPAASPTAGAKEKPAKEKKVDITAKNAARKASDAAAAAPAADHPLLLRHLRGHQGDILSVAVGADGRHVASVSADETLRLWTLTDSDMKNAHFARHNMKKGEHGTAVAITADDQYVVVAIEPRHVIAVLAIKDERKPDGPQQSFLTPLREFATPHKQPITSLAVASNNSAVVTMAEGSTDLTVHVFSLTGTLLQSLPVAQLCNYSLAVSSDAHFLGLATKLPDTKLYEFVRRKDAKGAAAASSSTFERLEHAATLRGLKRGVKRLAFGLPSSGLLVSGGVDGAFCEHQLAVRGNVRSEDPKLMARTETGLPSVDQLDVHEDEDAASVDQRPPLIALAQGATLQLWAGTRGSKPAKLLAAVPAQQAHKGAVTALAFSRPPPGSHARAVLVTAGENKTVSVWKLPQL